MAVTKPSERQEREQDGSERESPELAQIDALIRECQNRMSGVSDGVLSHATKQATLKMYKELREQAERKDVRAQRLEWMKDNVRYLESMIDKASAERAQFARELEDAVEKKWINKADVSKWMATFDDPSLLEMYRSTWLRETWKNKYVAGWKSLAEARDRVLKRAAAAGLTTKQLPELAEVQRDDLFLKEGRTFPDRKSLVAALDAKITSAAEGRLGTVRQMEALLTPASRGKDRSLHPAKVGEWLKKIAAEPATYTPAVMASYMEGWKRARARYDALAARYAAEGKPDGCAPLTVNGFLELSYYARLALLDETENRLDAAKRVREGRAQELDAEKEAIRRAIDLKDVDTARARLDALKGAHPRDEDVRTMAAHLAVVAAEVAEERDADEDDAGSTETALSELQAIRQGVPPSLARHYDYLLQQGNAEEAAVFFLSMKVRADRMKSGRTSQHDEYMASLAAEEADETELVPERATIAARDEEADDTDLLVTDRTPTSATIALLKAHGSPSPRSPALVIEGMPYEQLPQLVEMNERALRHLRLLERAERKKDPVDAAA